MINFSDDKIFDNRTYKYLFPLLRTYGQGFCTNFSKLFKLGIFIGDMNYYTVKPTVVPSLYVVVRLPRIKDHRMSDNDRAYLEWFTNFKQFLRHQQYYETDYSIDVDKHMFVFKLLNNLSNVIDNFLMGKYSQMFTKEQVNKYFTFTLGQTAIEKERNKATEEIRSILLHDNTYAQTYLDKINKQFGTTLKLENNVNWEFDTPPNLSEEILNY